MERQNVAAWRKIQGDHPDLAYTLNNVGWILVAEGNWVEARPFLVEALALGRKQLGEKHLMVGAATGHLGRVYQGLGDYPMAEKYLRQALAIMQGNGAEGWHVSNMLAYLAGLDLDRGDYSGVEDYAGKELNMRRKLGGGEHPQVASALIDMALVREFKGDIAGAEPLFQSALQIRMKTLPPGHPDIIAAQTRMGEALVAQGKARQAEPMLREAVLSARSEPFPLLPWQVAEPENALGYCLLKTGRPAEGERLLRDTRIPLNAYPVRLLRKQMLERIPD